MHYEGIDEATSRLARSVASVDGQLYYVQDVYLVDDKIFLSVFSLPISSGAQAQSIPLGKVSSIFSLGYTNIFPAKEALFITRVPARHHRQGLSNHNVQITSGKHGEEGHNRWNFEGLATDPRYSKDLIKMFKEEYPTFSEALELVNRREVSRWAFNLMFAVGLDDFREDFLIYYAGKPIGWGDGSSFKLKEKYRHLTESIQELGVNVEK